MKIHIEYTNYLGIKKTTKLTPKQVTSLCKDMDRVEIVKRLEQACKYYSGKYWVKGFINDIEVCNYQWAEV